VFLTPCGICRQFMREFSKDLVIVLTKPGENKEVRVVTLNELLPESFGPEDLA
jgi:cytidine deaminase